MVRIECDYYDLSKNDEEHMMEIAKKLECGISYAVQDLGYKRAETELSKPDFLSMVTTGDSKKGREY